MTSPNENYTSWHTGMKVVCQDASYTSVSGIKELEEGRVYTIRWVGFDRHADAICVRLAEYFRKPLTFGDEVEFELYGEKPFFAHRFRPVVTRKTDISIFKAILSNPRKKLHTEDA